MNQKAVLASVTIGAVVLIAGGGFYVYKRQAQSQATESRAHLQAALENMKARAENPDQKPFREKNMTDLKNRMAPGSEARTRTVQAGIVFFDLGLNNAWEAAQYNEFASELLSVFAETPKTAEDKRLRNLSFQLAKRVLPRTNDSEIVRRVDDLIATKHSDVYEAAVFLDLGSQLPEAPAHFVEAHAKCVVNKDLGISQSCIQMIEQIQNRSVREQIARSLLAKWSTLNEALQPYAVKTLISQHASMESEAKKLLEVSSQKTGEVWSDVFIFGVAELGAIDTYRDKLNQIASSAETSALRQRATELLKQK